MTYNSFAKVLCEYGFVCLTCLDKVPNLEVDDWGVGIMDASQKILKNMSAGGGYKMIP